MEELISKRDAIEVIEDELDKIDHVPQWVFDRLTNRLRELPSVEPQWIPCKEKTPSNTKKTYWVCTDNGIQCECRWTNNIYGFGETDRWGWSFLDKPRYTEIVAWRELPEPYKEKDGAN